MVNELFENTIEKLHIGEDKIVNMMIATKAQEKHKATAAAAAAKATSGNKCSRNDKGKKVCKHCGNFHKGLCRLKDTKDDILKGGKGNPPKQKGAKRSKITESTHQLNVKIDNLKANASRTTWAKGIAEAEYKSIALLAANKQDIDAKQVIDIPSDDLANYKQQYQYMNWVNSLLVFDNVKIRPQVKKHSNKEKLNQQIYAETVIMVKLKNGQCRMLRALVDSGCSKTIVLKSLL